MKALNHKERNEQLVKFSLLFLLLIALTTFSMYWIVGFTPKVNSAKWEKVKSYNQFRSQEKKVISRIDSLDSQFNRLLSLTREYDIINNGIEPQINFSGFVEMTDTSSLRLLKELDFSYKNMLRILVNQQQDLLLLRKNLKECEDDNGKLKEEKEDLKNDIKQAESSSD
ncbi:MAG TPA: type VI secretion system TssO [Flavobacteriales bacterium]|jgi:peptidoglycan hydrolase CwlO-like protein|nr:type VI secretion system TssO [Flavobacteriales bacterium]